MCVGLLEVASDIWCQRAPNDVLGPSLREHWLGPLARQAIDLANRLPPLGLDVLDHPRADELVRPGPRLAPNLDLCAPILLELVSGRSPTCQQVVGPLALLVVPLGAVGALVVPISGPPAILVDVLELAVVAARHQKDARFLRRPRRLVPARLEPPLDARNVH